MNLIIVGLNHRTSPVEIREKLSFPAQTIGEPLRKLTNHYGLNEAVILSTCNRVEVLAITNDIEKGTWQIKGSYPNSTASLKALDDHLTSTVAPP